MVEFIALQAARSRLSELVRRVEAGEEIVIARRGKPVVKLLPFGPVPVLPRRPGRLRGVIALDETFWDPLPDEETGEGTVSQ